MNINGGNPMPGATERPRSLGQVVEDLNSAWRYVEQTEIEAAAAMDDRLGVLEAELLRCDAADVTGFTLQMIVLTSKAECAGLDDDLVASLRAKGRRMAALHLAGDWRDLAERYVGPVNFSG